MASESLFLLKKKMNTTSKMKSDKDNFQMKPNNDINYISVKTNYRKVFRP